jgi:hypothetical protein
MGVDRVGGARPAAGLPVGLLALDDSQAGGSDRASQPDPEATGTLDDRRVAGGEVKRGANGTLGAGRWGHAGT